MPHILSLILMHTICTSFLLPSLQHTIFIQKITSLFQSWIIWAFLYSAIVSSLSCSKEPKHSVCKPEIPSAPAQDSSPAQTEKSRGDMSSYFLCYMDFMLLSFILVKREKFSVPAQQLNEAAGYFQRFQVLLMDLNNYSVC